MNPTGTPIPGGNILAELNPEKVLGTKSIMDNYAVKVFLAASVTVAVIGLVILVTHMPKNAPAPKKDNEKKSNFTLNDMNQAFADKAASKIEDTNNAFRVATNPTFNRIQKAFNKEMQIK
jgi:hypothetical protein